MKLNSLIDNIRDSIVTGLGKKVSVRDKSLLNVLISDIEDDTAVNNPGGSDRLYFKHTLKDILRDYLVPRWNLRFPISRMVIQLLILLTLIPLLVGYTFIVLIDLLLGRKISFFKVMHSPRTNMLISLSILIGSLTILVSMFVFFVNDVMLYSPQRDINSKGALTISQSCHREHSIFMFSSASLWADTGIELVEGDVVTISGSGSFESSIWDKTANAKNNSRPQYSLVNIAYNDRTGDTIKKSDNMRFCIFNDTIDRTNQARFGSLLFQIQPSQRKCVNKNTDTLHPICQAHLDPVSGVLNERFRVGSPGTLFVCVNDIYLTEELVYKMFECDADSIWHVTSGSESALKLHLQGHETADTIPHGYISGLRDNLLALASTPDGRAHWLHDNCGDILLSIRVERNIWSGSALGPIDKIYSYVFRGLENLIFPDAGNSCALMVLIMCLVVWFILDIIIGTVIRHHINNKNKPKKL